MSIFRWLPFGKVPEVSAAALEEKRGSVQILDVRTRKEFAESHIEGAVSLPITGFSRAAVEALGLDPARPVVAICLSAHRSIPAVRQLTAMGYDACQLKGGMRAWWKEDRPVVKS